MGQRLVTAPPSTPALSNGPAMARWRRRRWRACVSFSGSSSDIPQWQVFLTIVDSYSAGATRNARQPRTVISGIAVSAGVHDPWYATSVPTVSGS